MMAFLVDNYRRVVGGGRSKKKCSFSILLSRHKLSNLEIAGFSS